MLFSPTVPAAAGAVVAVVGVLTLRHQRKTSAWVKRTRRSDDDAQDFEDAAAYLRKLVEMLCDRTHKPCHAGDFESLHGLRHLLDDAAQATAAVRPELEAVVGCLDRYLATELPRVPATGRAGITAPTAQLEAAMRQEHARIELKNAAGTAQQRIRALRRAV
ncbi:hypothetical protein [Streptomyces sp. GbtcB6]|uniref:hypothetical protein n=1 Tax=Streptomyces sp. GbtcB6 TaxID=2824751 RepID=UPI001C30342C|nr:hypothetical protein [Streptomyces sp. GbtcB6]